MLCLIFGTHHGACEPAGEMPERADRRIWDFSGDEFKPDRRRWAFTWDEKKIVELHVPVVVNGKHDCTNLQDRSPLRIGPVYRHTDCLGWEEYPGKGHCVPVFFWCFSDVCPWLLLQMGSWAREQTDLGLTLGVSTTFWKMSEERWVELVWSIRRRVLYICYVLLGTCKSSF